MRFSLADSLFWVAVAVCVVAQLAIVRSVATTRPVDSRSATTSRWRSAAEVVWVVLPAIGLGAVLVMTWRAMHPAP